MLLKPPSAYLHQIAFTFPGARRGLYQRLREAFLQHPKVIELTDQFGIALNERTILLEETWHQQTPTEFYRSYADAVLTVVLFDGDYQNSQGAYPEWQNIERSGAQLHGRILPVKFDQQNEYRIWGPHFNGLVDLRSCSDDDERLAELLPRILAVWQKIILPWTEPPKNRVIYFGDHRPAETDSKTAYVPLPRLVYANRSEIKGLIASHDFFRPCPLRSTCLYAPPECAQDWGLFEDVLTHVSKARSFYRRNSVRIPVFLPDESIDASPRSLQELIYRKNAGDLEVQNAWEPNYRRTSSFGEWLSEVNRKSLINIISGSGSTKADILSRVQLDRGIQNTDVILNVWQWREASMYPELQPYDLDIPGLYHAAHDAESNHSQGSNLIEESEDLRRDFEEWQLMLRDQDASADLLNRVLAALKERPFLFQQLAGTSLKRRPFY